MYTSVFHSYKIKISINKFVIPPRVKLQTEFSVKGSSQKNEWTFQLHGHWNYCTYINVTM
jgi:hypothetical protein